MTANAQFFLGRERVVREIVNGVLGAQPASFSVVGPRLVGKSRLLQYLDSPDGPLLASEGVDPRPAQFADASRVVPIRVDCNSPAAREDFMAFLFNEVAAALNRDPSLPVRLEEEGNGSASGSYAQRLLAVMRRLNDRGYRPVLLLDGFERVFTELPADTANELRPLTLHAALVTATDQPLHDLDRTLAASPLFNLMTQLFLGLLEPDATRQWLSEYAESYPGIKPIVADLQVLTGTHPYLLRRLGDSLLETRRMMVLDDHVGREHLPLIRLRLAEHGRLLFESLWKRIQNPPERVKRHVVFDLLRRMLSGPITMSSVSREESVALNWLINQAMVICCGSGRGVGYELFSPLLEEFLAERLPPAATATPKVPAPTDIHPQASNEAIGGLTRIETTLLDYFLMHSRQIISTDQLLRDVWKRPDATPRRVQEAIRRLRLELEQVDPPLGVIENDRGRGYRFVPAQ